MREMWWGEASGKYDVLCYPCCEFVRSIVAGILTPLVALMGKKLEHNVAHETARVRAKSFYLHLFLSASSASASASSKASDETYCNP